MSPSAPKDPHRVKLAFILAIQPNFCRIPALAHYLLKKPCDAGRCPHKTANRLTKNPLSQRARSDPIPIPIYTSSSWISRGQLAPGDILLWQIPL